MVTISLIVLMMVTNIRDASLRRLAFLGILLFGLVSLLGDIIYEGARGIIPSYLYHLGATAFIVGLATGLGEFVGYGLRLISGYLADTTRAYWFFTIMGYGLIISVPLLALAGHWQIAVALIVVERFAKALRSPSRDALLSFVSKGIGAGKAFGLHELMDQVGATAGPAIVTATLFLSGDNYKLALSVLGIPYALLLVVLLTAYVKLKPYTQGISEKNEDVEDNNPRGTLPFGYKLYALAVLLNTMGLTYGSLILYKATPLLSAWLIPTLYLAIQAVDAISAPIAGLLYDKIGRRILYLPFILSVLPTPLVFMGKLGYVIAGALIFGFIYGMQESIYRAAVTDLAPIRVRGFAYGVFYALYGIGFLLSGLILGYMLDAKLIVPATLYTLISQALAMFLLHKSIGIR